MSLCLLSLFAGAAVSPWAPAVQFALGLLVTTAAGTALALGCGAPLVGTLACAAAMFVAAQIGYGVGIIGIAVAHAHRETSEAKRHALTSAHEPSMK